MENLTNVTVRLVPWLREKWAGVEQVRQGLTVHVILGPSEKLQVENEYLANIPIIWFQPTRDHSAHAFKITALALSTGN